MNLNEILFKWTNAVKKLYWKFNNSNIKNVYIKLSSFII